MKHHYIPQFYLRPWLGADHKLEEFGIEPFSGQIRSRRRGTNSTGYVEDLYILPGVTEETQHNVERIFMGAVDATAKIARDQLMAGNDLTGELRVSWSRFLLSLLMRTPEQIAAFKRSIAEDWQNPSETALRNYQQRRKPEWPQTLQGFLNIDPTLAERSALFTAMKMMQNENVIDRFAGALWCVVDISSLSETFLTGDRPFIMTNGLERADGHFALPIGPKHLFLAFMNPDFAHYVRNADIGEVIAAANLGVVGQSRKHVYSTGRDDIEYVRKHMGTLDYMVLIPETVYQSPR